MLQANNKNPFVKLERLPSSFINTFLENSQSSENEKIEERNGRCPRKAKRKVKKFFYQAGDSDSDTQEFDDKSSNYRKGSDNKSYSRKVKRSFYQAGDSDSDYTQELDDKSSNYRKGSDNKSYSSAKKKGKKQKTSKVKELSEYEKIVLKNKNEKLAFLESLKMDEVKAGFAEAFNSVYGTARQKRIPKAKPPVEPRLKFERKSKKGIDLSEEAIRKRAFSEANESLQQLLEKKEIVKLPSVLKFKDILESEQTYENFTNDFKDLYLGNTKPITDYTSHFGNMKALESRSSNYISSLIFHPMTEKIIIVGDGRYGELFLWNLNSGSKPYCFKPHSSKVTQLKFIPENPHLIVSSSKDGTMRVGDLVKNVFKKVYDLSDRVFCTDFDFLSPHTLLVSQDDGCVSLVDVRGPASKRNKSEIICQSLDSSVRSISVHPLDKNQYLTPGKNGSLCLWDVRNSGIHPVKEVIQFNQSPLYAALFSPLTGKSVLTSSKSGRTSIYDTSDWENVRLMHSMKSSFVAASGIYYRPCSTWLPGSDCNFVVRKKIYPPRIDIYNKARRIFKFVLQMRPSAATSLFHAFHPSVPMLVSLTSARMIVFTDRAL